MLERFPKVTQALIHVCNEIGLGVFKTPFNPEIYGVDYEAPTEQELEEIYSKFEQLLTPLSEEELLIVSIRGDEEAERLIELYQLEEFNNFLNRYAEEDV